MSAREDADSQDRWQASAAGFSGTENAADSRYLTIAALPALYYTEGDGCPLFCQYCASEPPHDCVQCITGYALFYTAGQKVCARAVQSCLRQSEISFVCEECYQGFDLWFDYHPFGQCIQRIENCITAQSATECSYCANGYFGTQCQECAANCEVCTYTEGCIRCKTRSGFALQGGQCKKSMWQLCVSDDDCLAGLHCMLHYTKIRSCITPRGGSCANDNECSFGFKCTEGTCQATNCIAENCDSCHPGGVMCNKCKTGYWLDELSNCAPCPDGCAQCVSGSVCLECAFKTQRSIDGHCAYYPWVWAALGCAITVVLLCPVFGLFFCRRKARK